MMARAARMLVLLAALGGQMRTPFASGERLLYQVGWMDLVQVATAEVSATRTSRAADAPGWHFQAEAHTQGAFRLIYTLDDRFDSYADAALRTERYEQMLAEQGRQVRRVSGPQAARDPLALLFYLRTVDWGPATVVRAAAFDGQRRWPMRWRCRPGSSPRCGWRWWPRRTTAGRRCGCACGWRVTAAPRRCASRPKRPSAACAACWRRAASSARSSRGGCARRASHSACPPPEAPPARWLPSRSRNGR